MAKPPQEKETHTHPHKTGDEPETGSVGSMPPGMGAAGGGGSEPSHGSTGPKPPAGRQAVKAAAPEEAEPDAAAVAAAQLKEAQAHSISGNVYLVKTQVIGGPDVGTVAADVDFPKGTDFARLLRIEAIEPAAPLKSDPAAKLHSAEHLEEVEELQQLAERLDKENERLNAENTRLKAEIERKEK